jgi:hypothetical protein
VAPGGGWTAPGGGLIVSFYVMQVVPDYCSTQMCMWDYPSTTVSLLFFPITDRDCVVLPYVDISMPSPLMDEVIVACPPGRNNNDTRGRAIYIGVVADSSISITHAYSSSSSKLMI